MASLYCQGSGEEPDVDSFEKTKVYYSNRQAGKQQVKGRQKSVVQGGMARHRTIGRLRAGRMVQIRES
jgi:hypothetical protein